MSKKDDNLIEELNSQEERIIYIENYLKKKDPHFFELSNQQDIDDKKIGQEESKEQDNNKDNTFQKVNNDTQRSFPIFSFSQIITFLGILGVIIGIISFFFYAVANNIIGEAAQIGIGITIGLIMFIASYHLREKNVVWSNIVFGGGYFVELLSVGVGVQVYETIPMLAGILLLMLFLVSSLLFSIKFSSRTIAYFSLVGGYIIPFITGFSDGMFIVFFYILLSLALLVISIFKNWSDLRLTSTLAVIFFFTFFYASELKRSLDKEVIIIFWIIVFIIYNAASLWSSVNNRSRIPVLDSIIVGILPVVLILYLFSLFKITPESFGIIFMFLSFLYLFAIVTFKKIKGKIDVTLSYTLFVAGAILLNLGLVSLLFDTLGYKFLIVFFVPQWFLFSFLKDKVDERLLFSIFSYIFLFFSFLWYTFTIGSSGDIGVSTFFLMMHLTIPIGFVYLYKNVDSSMFNKIGFIIAGYLVIYSIYGYLELFLRSLPALGDIILSVLWLVYCLGLFFIIKEKKSRLLIVVLLGITLIKIAFRDLLFLDGIYRIIGFTLFGVLLLIGGYYLKNEKLF